MTFIQEACGKNVYQAGPQAIEKRASRLISESKVDTVPRM